MRPLRVALYFLVASIVLSLLVGCASTLDEIGKGPCAEGSPDGEVEAEAAPGLIEDAASRLEGEHLLILICAVLAASLLFVAIRKGGPVAYFAIGVAGLIGYLMLSGCSAARTAAPDVNETLPAPAADVFDYCLDGT